MQCSAGLNPDKSRWRKGDLSCESQVRQHFNVKVEANRSVDVNSCPGFSQVNLRGEIEAPTFLLWETPHFAKAPRGEEVT